MLKTKKYNAWFSNVALILLTLIIINNLGYKFKFDYIILMYVLFIFLLRYMFGRRVIYFIVFVSFLYLPIGWYYGSPNISLAASLVETQSHEAMGFIMDYSPYFMLYWVISFTLSFLLVKFAIKRFSINKYFLMILAVIAIGVMVKGYSRINSNDHNIYEKITKLRIIPVSFVADSIAIFSEYEREVALRKELASLPPSWRVTHSSTLSDEIKILIVGESVRRDFMQIYGFPLPNTPFLSTANGLFWNNFIAAGSNTVSSLKHMLTLNHGVVPELNNNIVTLAQAGGYEVYWLSNQGRLGIHDTYISSIAAYSDYEYFSRKGDYDDRVISDRVLLPEFEKIIKKGGQQKNKLIVLHLFDAHTPFCNTIKELEFDYVNKKLSCYVQRINNTDRLLEDIVKITRSETEHYSLMYFSDHGLVSRDNGTNLKHGVGDSKKEAYEIPLFIIGNQYSDKQYIDTIKNGYQFVFGIAEWLGIKVEQNTDNYSLFDNEQTKAMFIQDERLMELSSLSSDGFNVSQTAQ